MQRYVVLITAIMFWASGLNAARFLFDYTKNETAGNADWIIDGDYPYPQPQNPTSPTDWDRAISSWGYALYQLGHEVVTLPPDSAITYGTSSPMDLSNFDVFVMVEPQNPLSSSEIQAIVDFVNNGGGFLMIADHNASDRDNDGWDSPRVFNDAFEDIFGIHFDTTGEANNSISGAWTNVSSDTNDSIIYGPLGDVDTFGYWSGDVAILRTDINPSLRGHIWKNGEPEGSTQNVIVFTGTYGNGKIGGFGDSSPVDDGTGNPGDNLHDGWYTYKDSTLTLNLCLWLAKTGTQSQNNPPVISDMQHIPSSPTDTDSVVVRATITDDHGISTDSLYLSVDNGTYTPSYHINQIGDTFYFNIGKYPSGTEISYFVIAIDDSGAKTYSDTTSYTVRSSSLTITTIYEIQDTSDATFQGDTSNYFGDTVTTEGIITGVYSRGFFLEDKNGGAWGGIWIYYGSGADTLFARGDSVRVKGMVTEYNGLTEISPDTVIILQHNVSLPSPVTVTTSDANKEDYEGVLLRVENATCTNPDLGYGEWEVNDGTGPLRVDDMGYSYTPLQDSVYNITAPLYYSYGNYKLEPRDANDIELVTGSQNNPPVISNLHHVPSSPTENDSVIVVATITDDHGISTDSLYLSVNSGTYTASYHFQQTGDTFYFNIGKYPEGTNISYYVIAKDDSGAITYSDTLSYTVSGYGGQMNAGVVINEIMYNPSTSWGDDAYFEYTEVWNATPDTVDMTGWYLMDNTPGKVAHVPDGTKVPPYHFVVFARNVDSLLSKADYQTYLTDGDEILINIADSVQLSNGGEWVKLVDNNGVTVDSVFYDDGNGWPTSPDGDGPSLELKDPTIDNNDPTNWAASGSGKVSDYGTPGDTNSVFVVTLFEQHPQKTQILSNKVTILSAKEFTAKYLDDARYKVYDIKGQRIRKGISLRKGVYFVVSRDKQKTPQRFLILR